MWYLAEVATTIIAASIPLLRTLVKDLASSLERNSFSMGTRADRRSIRGAQSAIILASEASGGLDRLGDTGSETSILGSVGTERKVTRTFTTTTSSWNDKGDIDNVNHEMHNLPRFPI